MNEQEHYTLQKIKELSVNEIVSDSPAIFASINRMLENNPDNYDEIQKIKDDISGEIVSKALKKQRIKFWMVLSAIAIVGGVDFLLYYLIQLDKNGIIQLPYFVQDIAFFGSVLGFVFGIPIIIGLLVWMSALRECDKYIPGFSKEYVPFYRLIKGAVIFVGALSILFGAGYFVQAIKLDKLLYNLGFSKKFVMSLVSLISQVLFMVIIGVILTNIDKIRKMLWTKKNTTKK